MYSEKQTIKQYYRVERQEIAFLKYIFEGCDNMSVLTTIDGKAGTVVLSVAPGCEEDVLVMIDRLRKDILIEDIPMPEGAENIY